MSKSLVSVILEEMLDSLASCKHFTAEEIDQIKAACSNGSIKKDKKVSSILTKVGGANEAV